jgi:hypothetical protein
VIFISKLSATACSWWHFCLFRTAWSPSVPNPSACQPPPH